MSIPKHLKEKPILGVDNYESEVAGSSPVQTAKVLLMSIFSHLKSSKDSIKSTL